MFKNMVSEVGIGSECRYEPVMVVSNMFVQRMYCEDGEALLPGEWKTVALLASLVERGDPAFCCVSMPASQWMNLLGFPACGGRDVSRYISQVEALTQKTCYICRIPGECSMHNWIDMFDVNRVDNTVSIRLCSDFLPFFSSFVQPYTAVQLFYLMELSNKYSCDLYIILKSALVRGYWDIRVPALLRRLGGPQWRLSYLESRILQPCLKEISEKTDLIVSYTVQHDQRGSSKIIRFFIKRKPCLPRGKRLYGSSGPIVVPGLCEKGKKQKKLCSLRLAYRTELAQTRRAVSDNAARIATEAYRREYSAFH